MKNFWCLTFFMICSLALFSCDDDDDKVVIDEAWKARNEAVIEQIRNDASFTPIMSADRQDSIFYKVLHEGTGTVYPAITSTVEVRYKGWLITDEVFDSTAGYDTPETDDDLTYTFTLLNSSSPTSFNVIEGWGIALQHMKVGDKWLVYLPWTLAYGTTGNSGGSVTIPGCSTLVFEIELINIVSQSM